MTYGDSAWRFSRLWISPLTRLLTRPRLYGGERLPREGGCVLAVNHLHWVDIPLVGSLSPRMINYVTKREAFELPLGLGWYIGLHGTIAVRRGESDRDAVRHMREAAHARPDGRSLRRGHAAEARASGEGAAGRGDGGAPGGRAGDPGGGLRHAVLAARQLRAVLGRDRRARALRGAAEGRAGYKEATAEIERRINVLFDWLADVHARGRPRGETPPI